MVSCGRDNVRLWRVKEGQLRSAPVNLGEYHLMEFTDVCFEAGYHADKDPAERIVSVTCIHLCMISVPWKSFTVHIIMLGIKNYQNFNITVVSTFK